MPGAEQLRVMRAPVTDAIDWTQPWLVPLLQARDRVPGAAAWRATADLVAIASGLTNHRGLPLRFVAQDTLPNCEAYEAFISRTGGVPTRDNLHDFFNALVWLTYPASKRQLNAIQAAELERNATATENPGSGNPTRGKLRDRATIFDENAAILLSAEPSIEHALRNHDWRECLVKSRTAFGTTCELRLFGHALFEKLVTPYRAITAHVWVLPVERDYFALDDGNRRVFVDRLLASSLAQRLLDQSPTPLPVLGVPGWAPVQDAAFYADKAVFRDKRTG